MAELTIYSADNAPDDAKPSLEAAKAAFAHTQLDPFMRGNEWMKPAVKPAA